MTCVLRASVINLTYRYLFWGHGGAVIVGDEPAGSQVPSVTSGN